MVPGLDDSLRMRLLGDVTDLIWEEAKEKPKSLVALRFQGATPYHHLAKAFDEDSLPQFYEILADPDASGYKKDQAVIFIGQIATRGNVEAQKALREFIAGRVNWDKWKHNGREVDLLVISKFHALEMLGYLGTQETHQFLQTVLSTEGASSVATHLAEGVPATAFSRGALLDNLRGFAAKGLAFSGAPSALESIRKEYTAAKQACLDANVLESHHFYQLCDAMARIDVIAEIGLDKHRSLYDRSGDYSRIYGKHVRKYMLRQMGPLVEKSP